MKHNTAKNSIFFIHLNSQHLDTIEWKYIRCGFLVFRRNQSFNQSFKATPRPHRMKFFSNRSRYFRRNQHTLKTFSQIKKKADGKDMTAVSLRND